MEYCKYHPIKPATYACEHCLTSHCDQCVDDSEPTGNERCFICGYKVNSLGAVYTVEPFWRRLQQSFRYPANKSVVVLILIVSFLTNIILYFPLGVLLSLIFVGVIFKYSFSCLQNTANGVMVAPDVSEAYEGGAGIVLRLILINIVLAVLTYCVFRLFGANLARIISIVLVAGMPAIIINFALTEDVAEAINPINMLRLIAAVGLPYGLLLAFLMIMSASVGIINEMIGSNYSIISSTLQFAVLYYYMVVVFHIMGYMIFQYQGKLGFAVREDYGIEEEARSSESIISARINVLLKEGDYEGVIKVFNEGLKKYPLDKELNTRYFDFLIVTRNIEQLTRYSPLYFEFLRNSRREDKICTSYKQVLLLKPDFVPETPELRLFLARSCQNSGNPLLSVRLINGLHREFPGFPELIPAYEMMAQSLEELPGMSKQLNKCRQLISHFKRNQVNETKIELPVKESRSATVKARTTKPFKSINESLSQNTNSE